MINNNEIKSILTDYGQEYIAKETDQLGRYCYISYKEHGIFEIQANVSILGVEHFLIYPNSIREVRLKTKDK